MAQCWDSLLLAAWGILPLASIQSQLERWMVTHGLHLRTHHQESALCSLFLPTLLHGARGAWRHCRLTSSSSRVRLWLPGVRWDQEVCKLCLPLAHCQEERRSQQAGKQQVLLLQARHLGLGQCHPQPQQSHPRLHL